MTVKSTSQADVCVIVPAFNAAATIKRAVMSAAQQTLLPAEIVVCDDGSEDRTAEIVESLGRDINGIKVSVVRQPNKGAGAARNHAISKTSAEWLAFLDADDEWLPTKLEASLAMLENTDRVLVAHNYIQVSPDGVEQMIDCTRRYRAHGGSFVGLYRYGFIATSTVVVKRDAVEAAGGFDETLATAQDFDLWLKVLRPADAGFMVFDAALMRYTVNPTGITSHTGRRLDCSMRVALRHRPGPASLLFRIAAVHYEAFNSYRGSARYDKALWVCILMMGRLLLACLDGLIPAPLRSGLARWAIPLMGVWIVIAFGAYMYRFNHLIVAFYQLVTGL